MSKKIPILALILIAIITTSVVSYIWLTNENSRTGNHESSTDPLDTGNVEGAITNYQGLPLTGISVVIMNETASLTEKTAETNEEGCYQLTGIPPGDYKVEFLDNQNSRIGLQTVTIESGETSIVDFNTLANVTCPDDHSSYKWTPIGTFSENFNWICLKCGHSWTETLTEDAYQSWRNQFLKPIFVRDYTLLYLRTVLKKDVPDPLRLRWEGDRETPEQTLGYETYVYKAEGITVTIGYAVVLPENTIYEIKVELGDLPVWKGQLNRREFTTDDQVNNALYDYYSGVGLFEKGIHVSATTQNPMIREATTDAEGTNVVNDYWKQIKENVTDTASSEDFISIIVSRGDYPTGGYEIKINQFSWLESYPVKFRLQTDFIDPGEGVAVTEALTNPLVLFPIGQLSPGEYQIEVHILQYILTFDQEGNPTYTQVQTFKEEVWTETFNIQ
jgi:hypothetical protein